LRGKIVVNVTLAANGAGFVILTAASFGQRVATILSCFQRWKIMKLIVKPLLANSSIVSSYALTDDPLLGTGTTGNFQNAIVSVRCSRTYDPGVGSESADLQWNPVDPSKWYYVTPEEGSGDIRLIAPNSFMVQSGSTAGTFSVLFYFSIDAEGSTNPAS
jgi:hypothetical protein